MFPAGCKPATPPSELPQTHTFDHAGYRSRPVHKLCSVMLPSYQFFCCPVCNILKNHSTVESSVSARCTLLL
jgi:hypothetical protein